jgi:hypothetical protein
MEKIKRYYCGNGDGMFEDDKNGHWVEYSEYKAIVKALTEQLLKHAVISWVAASERLPEIPSENYLVVKNGIVSISLFRGDWNKFQCDLHDIQEVTHWAECPKPPCL